MVTALTIKVIKKNAKYRLNEVKISKCGYLLRVFFEESRLLSTDCIVWDIGLKEDSVFMCVWFCCVKHDLVLLFEKMSSSIFVKGR